MRLRGPQRPHLCHRESTRYDRRSTMIATNQHFRAWSKTFPAPAMTRFPVDRLAHQATIFEMNTESAR
ncbi:ATP-binding protein [Celeribacter sp. ULVN23_4]|uniref:ATP-binding protein n=1 Tax=uncultured Celeribacter sp. TaxID=1303376 RepID=UPI003747DF57